MAQPQPVALLGVGAAAPQRRLSAADIGAAWGRKGGRSTVAVCDADEDALTLAWQAADAATAAAGVPIDGMWWGTTRPPFAEGPSWTHLAASLRLGDGAVGAVTSGSTHAGLDALLAAWDAVIAGTVDHALVVTSDALRPGPGSGFESACGAGAVALVIGRGDGPATFTRRSTRWLAALDRYRGDLEPDTREAYDGRLFREEVFLPLVVEAGRALGADASSRWSLPDPDGRLGAAVGAGSWPSMTTGSCRPAIARSLGDSGAAAALVGAVPALAEAGPLSIVAYGGGRASGVAIEVTAPVPGATGALAALVATGTPVAYTEVLRTRGQLEPNGERVEMAVPPGSAMFVRGNAEILGLLGGRCVACSTIAFPPSIHPSCLSCGGDKFEVVPLARTGTVQTYVVNYAMPAPFVAPLPLVCADLDDGSRVMFQGSGTGDDLTIGAPIELVLRRYALERGVPVYGWKIRVTNVGAE